jgi:hypothetical protein
VLVAAGVVVALRAGTEPMPRDQDALAAAAPTGTVAPPNVYSRPAFQPPPYDHLPGRTPIPDPEASLDRRTVTGPLPSVGDGKPGAVTAGFAARLVLGRYCRQPWSVAVQTQPLTRDWARARVKATRSGWRPAYMDLRLTWDAEAAAYVWTGVLAQLGTCSPSR